MSYVAEVRGFFEISPPLNWAEIKESKFFEQNQNGQSDETDINLLVESTEEETDLGINQILFSDKAIPCHTSFDCRNLARAAQLFVDSMKKMDRTVRGEMVAQPHDYGDGGIWRVVINEDGVRKEEARLLWPDGTEVEFP